MKIKTFFCEPTGMQRRWLRRYADGPCPRDRSDYSSHEAMAQIENGPEATDDAGYLKPIPVDLFAQDPRWPAACACGYAFKPEDHWQVLTRTLYRRTDDPAASPVTRGELPPGATWDAWWAGDRYKGADGISLVVKLPGGHEWMPASRASNCTRPDDDQHRCWVRHGDARKAECTVDKNGDTCKAGAGSIKTDKYHGFLRKGFLVDGPDAKKPL